MHKPSDESHGNIHVYVMLHICSETTFDPTLTGYLDKNPGTLGPVLP
jgi:hypothetical protein